MKEKVNVTGCAGNDGYRPLYARAKEQERKC